MVCEFFQFATLRPVTLLAVNRVCSLIEPASNIIEVGKKGAVISVIQKKAVC